MIDQIFILCCNIIRYIAQLLGISYSACNILIFLHLLPGIYLFLSICVGISGFFKRSTIFKLICIIIAIIASLYFYEMLWYTLSEFNLDRISFDKSVELLHRDANMLNCSYQEINILYFIILPIVIISFLLSLIFSNNKCGQ